MKYGAKCTKNEEEVVTNIQQSTALMRLTRLDVSGLTLHFELHSRLHGPVEGDVTGQAS